MTAPHPGPRATWTRPEAMGAATDDSMRSRSGAGPHRLESAPATPIASRVSRGTVDR
jgi:hypothetical protein